MLNTTSIQQNTNLKTSQNYCKQRSHYDTSTHCKFEAFVMDIKIIEIENQKKMLQKHYSGYQVSMMQDNFCFRCYLFSCFCLNKILQSILQTFEFRWTFECMDLLYPQNQGKLRIPRRRTNPQYKRYLSNQILIRVQEQTLGIND